jgi:hypothetical protein
MTGSTGFQIIGFSLLGIFLIVFGFACFYTLYRSKKIKKRIIELEKKAAAAEKEQAEFESLTIPCPRCLGSGRCPKPGKEWAESDVKRFEDEAAVDNVPKVYRKAFKE